MRRYISNLERSYSNKNKSENKIASNSKFTRASQSPVEAAKALKVRKSLAELDHQYANLENAKNVYETAESSVMGISSLIQSTYEQLIYGANGTNSDNENKIIADTIGTYADEMVRLLNLTVADRKIFGGVNNSTNAFSIENGNVQYNGVDVDTYSDPSLFPDGQSSYTDIGIGMASDSTNRIDDQTALKITFNGAEITGCGISKPQVSLDLTKMTAGSSYSLDIVNNGTSTNISFTAGTTSTESAANINAALTAAYGNNNISISGDTGAFKVSDGSELYVTNNASAATQAEIEKTSTGYSNNFIQLTLDAAEALRSGDKQLTARYADLVYASQTTLSLSIAEIGNKEEFIDFNLERLTNNRYSLYEQQNNLEATDLGTEITNWKVLEAVYNASLQMGTQTLSKSIFDFM